MKNVIQCVNNGVVKTPGITKCVIHHFLSLFDIRNCSAKLPVSRLYNFPLVNATFIIPCSVFNIQYSSLHCSGNFQFRSCIISPLASANFIIPCSVFNIQYSSPLLTFAPYANNLQPWPADAAFADTQTGTLRRSC
jgi:hypothetical protein